MGEAADIDPNARRLILEDGGAFDYDALIVATGSKTSYYGNETWRNWAPSLKTVGPCDGKEAQMRTVA